MSPTFVRRVRLPADAATAFAWHERPGAWERLSPPWRGIREGARVTLDLGFPIGRLVLEHSGYQAGRMFRDRQVSGPFARYQHTHTFEPNGDRCTLEDRIDYELTPLRRPVAPVVEAELAALFAWRHRVTSLDLERLLGDARPTVVVTGASGMIGRELVAFLSTQGCRVRRLVRRRPREAAEIEWDPARGVLDPATLAGIDAVVHLSGAGLAEARWTAARKRELVDSRLLSTQLLAHALAAMPRKPAVLVSASAIGWYGDRGDEPLDEGSAPGEGFLADLAARWEAAARPAAEAGVRVVHPRFGMVLWPRGGSLGRLVAPTRWGVGGPLGSGRQWWSWVTLHDLLDMVLRAIIEPKLRGPFNAVAPEPTRQGQFAQVLGRVLRRPSLVSAPAFALRALLGRGLADGVVLASHRVQPRVLEASGFPYRDPRLDHALAALLGWAPAEVP